MSLYNTFLNSNKKWCLVSNSNYLNNLPFDIEILIIECVPNGDLLNLPTGLQFVFLNNKNILFESEEKKTVSEIKPASIADNKLLFNDDDIFSPRDASYFNYIQHNTHNFYTPHCGINTYSYALYPENITTLIKMKVPFGCKIYNYDKPIVNFDGFFNVNLAK
jgi:hypothetical protein